MDEQKLRQLFKNRSNCYADADDVVQAMDEDCFVETVKEFLCTHNTVGRREQLEVEDKDLPFADYLGKYYEPPRYEKVYDRKDGKGTDTEDEVIKNYRRAFHL